MSAKMAGLYKSPVGLQLVFVAANSGFELIAVAWLQTRIVDRGRQLEKRGRYLISHSCIPFVYSFIYRFVSAVQAETKIYYPSLSWWLKLCGIYGAVTPSLIFEGAQQNMCALMCDNPGSLEAVHNPLDTLCLFLHS